MTCLLDAHSALVGAAGAVQRAPIEKVPPLTAIKNDALQLQPPPDTSFASTRLLPFQR